MNKILFVTTRFPFPIFGGDKLRSFEEEENSIENNISSGLENFDINKTKEN